MSDDDDAKRRDEGAERGRRFRRKQRAAREAAANVMGANVTFGVPPRNALEIHTAQLHRYLLQVDVDPAISLVARVKLVTMALPAFARAAETTDLHKRMGDLEAALDAFKRRSK